MAVSATNTFAGSSTGTNSVSGIAIGSAFSGRVVVIAYNADDKSSATINGVSASLYIDAIGLVFASAVVSAGTTATLATASSTSTEVLGAWSLSGDPGLTVSDVGLDAATSCSVTDLATSTAVPAGDALVGYTVNFGAPGTTPSFSAGLSNNGSAFNGSFGGSIRMGSADISSTGAVTVSMTGDAGTTYISVVGYTPGGGGGGGTVNLEWHRPLSEPVRIRRAVPWQQSATYSPLPVPNTAPSFGWFKELAQPTYAKRKTQPDGTWWSSFTPASALPFGWFVQLSQPVLRRGLPVHQQQAATYSPLPVPNPVPSFGYFVPLEQPTYAKRKVQPDGTWWSTFTPGPFISVASWLVPLSEPVRRRGLPTFEQPSYTGVFLPVPSFGWFVPLAQPTYAKRKIQPDGTWWSTFTPVPFISVASWHVPLNEPRRFRRGLPVYEQAFAFYVQIPATVYTLTAATGSFLITVNDATLCRDFVNWVPSTIEGETWTAKAVASSTWTPKAKQDEEWTDEDPDPNTGHACN